ncbi:MOP flippase family protein [Acaryochloris sp. IP29b_bin.137]|uniref:MOP flippase family protein n=1 Tax=Acaryochloris sp. IP29b_bin.137 TaxID=2969217 RepID=UPI00261085FA|nr:MOP flippase family protein [Acaryochloris sp. IP29b_bin.137]
MSLRKKAIQGVIWTSLQNWGGQALFFLTFLVLARSLDPATFGLISMANIFIHFVQALLVQGFADAIVQRKELEPEHLDTAFWVNLGIGILLFLIGFASANLIANAFQQTELTSIIRWLSASVILNAFASTQQALLRRNLEFKSLAVRRLIGQSVGSAIAISMAFSGFGVWSLVSQQLLNNLVGTVLLWRMSDWRPGLKVSWRHFKDLFSFGINVMGMSVLVFFSLRSDDFLIGYYLGPEALGYYTIAYRLLVTLTQLIVDTVRQVVLPTFSRLQDDKEKMCQTFYKTTEMIGFVAFPAFLGMAVLSPELVVGLFGEQWQPSIPIMQVLAIVGLLRSVFNLSGVVIISLGKPSWNLGLMVLDTGGKIVAFFIAVRWGVVAVAASLLISTYLFAPLRLWVLRYLVNLNIRAYFTRYGTPLLGSGIMVGCIWLFRYFLNSYLDIKVLLSLCIAVGVLTYACTIFLLAPKFFKELLDLARSAIPSKS